MLSPEPEKRPQGPTLSQQHMGPPPGALAPAEEASYGGQPRRRLRTPALSCSGRRPGAGTCFEAIWPYTWNIAIEYHVHIPRIYLKIILVLVAAYLLVTSFRQTWALDVLILKDFERSSSNSRQFVKPAPGPRKEVLRIRGHDAAFASG